MISGDVLSTEYLGQDKPVNSNQPVVSVCVITFNHTPYIQECLDSILMQETDFPFEIIIGEDNSTDSTREICKHYAERHPDKIRLFLRTPDQKIEVNGKKTFHFNFIEVLKAARGEFIAYCDGDDYWIVKDKLQRQFDFMKKNPQCHLLCHKEPSAMKNSTAGWYDFKKLTKAIYLPHASNYFMKPFDFKKYEKALYEFLGGEMLVLYVAAKAGMVYHDENIVSYYRFNVNGVHNSLNLAQRLEGEMTQLKVVHRHFKMQLNVYLERRMVLVLRYNEITKRNKMEAFFYRFYIFLRRKKRAFFRIASRIQLMK